MDAMERPQAGDLVYCDPPYTHSQGIIYGAQDFDINLLWGKSFVIDERLARLTEERYLNHAPEWFV